jgi:hypothetical protein
MNTKLLRKLTLAAVVLMAMTSLQSCLDDNDDNKVNLTYPNAIVTLKTNPEDNTFFLQLDDKTKVIPTNIKKSPYDKKELRALANLEYSEESKEAGIKYAYVNWLDTITTKTMSADLGQEKNIADYHTDPLEIVNDWLTLVEDGYLNLRFRTYFGGGRPHVLRLVKTADPYEVTIYHDAKGDTWGQIRDGVIAFRLNDLPDTKGDTVALKVNWKSFSGNKNTTFKYCTRK